MKKIFFLIIINVLLFNSYSFSQDGTVTKAKLLTSLSVLHAEMTAGSVEKTRFYGLCINSEISFPTKVNELDVLFGAYIYDPDGYRGGGFYAGVKTYKGTSKFGLISSVALVYHSQQASERINSSSHYFTSNGFGGTFTLGCYIGNDKFMVSPTFRGIASGRNEQVYAAIGPELAFIFSF